MAGLREECGVVGIYGHDEAAKLSYLALHALQHRGQEGAGICTSDGQQLFAYRGRGLVGDVFGEDNLATLPGPMAIGHVRYSTAGDSSLRNVQPLVVRYRDGQVAIANTAVSILEPRTGPADALDHAIELLACVAHLDEATAPRANPNVGM